LRSRPDVILLVTDDHWHGELRCQGDLLVSCAIRLLLLFVVLILMTTAGSTVASCHASEPHAMKVKRSDVVMTHPPRNLETYRRYGATFVGWGFLPDSARVGDARLIQYWRRRVDDVHSAGLRFQGRVELDAGWKGMIDFDPDFMKSVCRTLDGEPIKLPWFSGRTHNGHPPYWFCTNSPGFHEFMKRQVETALTADVDALMLDSQTCTLQVLRMGGCFCRSCMAGFRKFLDEHTTPASLAEYGISDLNRFDYGKFLRRRGITVQQYSRQLRAWPPKIPLAQEYLSFQYAGATELVRAFRRHAEETAGRSIPVSSSVPMAPPERLFAVPYVSFLCSELSHQASTGQPPATVIFSYKLAEALDRPVVCTGVPRNDWSVVKTGNRRGLVRTWIAQAYAFGANFMVPVRMWCHDDEQGTHWYDSEPGDYECLYQFVRENADLFDDYDSVANVALLYSNAALRKGIWHARLAGINLPLNNVPYRFVVAGDDWLPNRLTAAELAGYRHIVVTEPAHLDAEQQAVLDAVKSRVVVWRNFNRVPPQIEREISLSGASNVTLVPRAKKGDANAPFVCHLLNRNYLPDTDSMEIQKNFTVTIADSLFGLKASSAKLHAPGTQAVECETRVLGDRTEVRIPELNVWAVLALTGDQRQQR